MFKNATRERIRKHSWSKHSNQTQFFKRIKDEIHLGLKDMKLIAEKLPEEQLEEIFTKDKIDPLLDALLKPRNKRTILIAETMAEAVYQKLALELPNSMVNSLGGDIGKTWVYAKLLSEHYDKPLKKVSRNK